jgi:hypothetical protein
MKAPVLMLLACGLALPSLGQVASYGRISATGGGFTGVLADGDAFGSDAASLGDLDGNGTPDVAVGAPGDDYGGTDRGAVWVLFLDYTGAVTGHVKIRQNSPGFTGSRLGDGDRFGERLVTVGDLNGDGVPDLSVAAPSDDDGGMDRGAVYTLFLTRNGPAQATQKISHAFGGLAGGLRDGDRFGSAIDALGDVNADGLGDLVVGAGGDDDGGTDRGAIWILRLGSNATIKSQQKISSTQGGFLGALSDGDRFGSGVAAIGDLDGDGIGDLAVGAAGGADGGAVWILFMNADGTVRAQQRLAHGEGGVDFDYLTIGVGIAGPGDLDGDGVPDLALADPGLDSGRGGLWIVFLNPDGTARGSTAADGSSLGGQLASGDAFPSSLRAIGDVDGDGAVDFGAGHPTRDDGGTDRGAAWILFGSYEDVSAQKLAAPANGSSDTATNLTLQWEALAGTMSYSLQVATSADFASPVVNAQGLIGTSRAVTGLAPLTTYFWRVQPASLQGLGGWSATWTFTTGTYAHAAPVTVEPAFGTAGVGTSPTLTWTASAGATGYDLTVSNSPTLDPAVVSLTGLGGTSHTVGPLEPERAFYWRVRATGPTGNSPWSDVSFFSTGSTAVGTEDGTPDRFALDQNYPNPFNPSTVVAYELPEAGEAFLAVTDVAGRVVRHLALGFRPAGSHRATIEAGDLPSGVYAYTLTAGRHGATRTMVVLR